MLLLLCSSDLWLLTFLLGCEWRVLGSAFCNRSEGNLACVTVKSGKQAGRQATLLQLFVVMCSLGACTLSLPSFHSLRFQQSFFPVRFVCSPSPSLLLCLSSSLFQRSPPSLQHFCLPLFSPSSLVISFKIYVLSMHFVQLLEGPPPV